MTDTALAFVGSVPPSYVADLLARPSTDRRIVDADRFGGLSAQETRRSTHTVTDEINQITHDPWLRRVLDCTLTGTAPAEHRLTVTVNEVQSDAEFSFRRLKDPHVVSFSPMHHLASGDWGVSSRGYRHGAWWVWSCS